MRAGPPCPSSPCKCPRALRWATVFSFVVHIDTHELVGRIAIMLEYDFKRLELKSAREGNFVKHSGAPNDSRRKSQATEK